MASHEVTLQVDEKEMQDKILSLYRDAGLRPSNLKDVFASFPEFTDKQIRPVIDLLLQEEKLVKISEILYFDAATIDKLKDELVGFIRREGDIDAPRFKDMTGLTRKFSIPLLEYFDRIKLTLRIEDKRILRKSE